MEFSTPASNLSPEAIRLREGEGCVVGLVEDDAAPASVCSLFFFPPRVARWRDNDEKVRGDEEINTPVLFRVLGWGRRGTSTEDECKIIYLQPREPCSLSHPSFVQKMFAHHPSHDGLNLN